MFVQLDDPVKSVRMIAASSPRAIEGFEIGKPAFGMGSEASSSRIAA